MQVQAQDQAMDSPFVIHSKLNEPSKNSILGNAYGQIVQVIQSTHENEAKKIDSIQKIFSNALDNFLECENYSVILEKENQKLNQNQKKLIAQAKLHWDDIKQLTTKIDDFAKEKGIVNLEIDHLKIELNNLVANKQSLIDKLDHLGKENILLENKVSSLTSDKTQLMDKQNQFSKKIVKAEGEIQTLQLKCETQITKQQHLKTELTQVQEKNKKIDSNLVSYELKVKKQLRINRFDKIGYLGTGIWLIAGVLGSGGMILPGLLLGAAAFLIFQMGKKFVKKETEKDLQNYAKLHPEASPSKVWAEVMEKTKKMPSYNMKHK